ncbi:hypothetical protein M409DRAFT_70424 [Zasmidium cellare ATCC 36951]|uniref:Hyaluronan/mRNA-binding protein domain-containing protein n=1 Tax=Zasmidium cellare ATCC 36951 TaxID=1080233 RepID=A0A6A6C2F5_ZASCE|nr:uncharacterized protein M409DRAFT_70424 [Zasmidium cellare ATCC 36951]KAF2160458.1 hypothetical protein M409DRAFT_70424 [Zasmidium cellare ATCC 36951]
MSAIASKNLYDLLGNDPELDPDREPEPPTKVIDKPVARTGKRNAGAEGPAKDTPRPAAGGRGGSQQTRGDQEPREFRGGEGRGRGRGGRGRGRGGAPRDDRHSHTGIGEHEKQAAHGWGAEDGNAEWADEKAGDAIAKAEANDDAGFTPDTAGQDPAFSNGPEAPTAAEEVAEPEEKTKSYDQYLAEQAEKRAALGGDVSVRKPNEGSSTKFPEGKALSRNPDAENFFIGSGGKSKKAKDAQDKKERVALDGQYYAAADSGDRGGRGGRGGGRGGRGRGEFRGERGGRGRGGRGDRGDRGDFRGAPRGDRGGARGGFNATDASAFPALGA